MLEALNRWISSGRFCEDLSTPLRPDPYLRPVASGLVCFGEETSTTGSWWRLRPGFWEWTVLAPSFDAAEAALLSGDNSGLCRDAADVDFKVGAASRLEDKWLIVVSDYSLDDAQRQ